MKKLVLLTMMLFALVGFSVAQQKGLSIPDDLCIVAYDGTEITELSYPELTVIQQDCAEIARKCVESVLKMVDGEKVPELELIPVRLIERGTT